MFNFFVGTLAVLGVVCFFYLVLSLLIWVVCVSFGLVFSWAYGLGLLAVVLLLKLFFK